MDPQEPDDFTNSGERLLADAVLALEQRGEAGLQEFLGAHPSDAEGIRAGLERLRRMGVLAPPPAAPVEPQRFGEFRVLRKLGAGGMGVVYVAEQTSLQRKVALKVVRPELLLSPTARERFQREVEAIARLQHPGIVPILAVGDEHGQPWFAMEYIEGRTLEQLLAVVDGQDPARTSGNALRSAFGAELRPGSGATGAFVASYWETCVRLVLQVAQTMVHVHERGIVHRDLKPSNVVVTPHGQAMVLDFGLAHVQDLQRVTRTEAPVGSPAYMAPEQVRGEAVDERVDVYGLGVTLYQLLTAKLPFEASNGEQLRAMILAGGARPLRAWNRAVPRDLEVLVAVALDRDRQRRYGSMAAFAADLERVVQRQPIHARPLGVSLRLVRWAQRHPTWTAVAAASLLATMVFPAVLWRVQVAHATDLERLAGQLRDERTVAESSYQEALTTIHQMLVRTGSEDLLATPGSEALRIAMLERAVSLYKRLDRVRPDGANLRHDRASALNRLGALLMQIGDLDEAVARLREGLAVLGDSMAHDDVAVRGYLWKLLGQAQQTMGDLRSASWSLQQGLCAMEDATANRPVERELRRQLAECHNSLALVRRDLGDGAGWRAGLAAAMQAKERLLAEAPNEPATVVAFAIGCVNTAQLAVHERRPADAVALLDRGIESMVAVRPPRVLSVVHRDKLATLYGQRATARQAQERFDEALTDHGVAFALRQELALEFPSTTDHLLRLAASMHNISRTLQDAGRAAEALVWEEEALAAQRRVMRASPGNREADQFLEYMLVGRCSLLLALRRFGELAPAAAELQRGVVSNEGRLNSARVHAFLSLYLEDTDAAASAAALQVAAAQVADAVAKGFRDLAHFEKGPFAKSYARLVGLPAYDDALAKLRAARGAK